MPIRNSKVEIIIPNIIESNRVDEMVVRVLNNEIVKTDNEGKTTAVKIRRFSLFIISRFQDRFNKSVKSSKNT
jgi:hypothetical protein